MRFAVCGKPSIRYPFGKEEKNMKKLTVLTLTLLLTLALVACDDAKKSDGEPASPDAPAEEAAADFVWTREGTFRNEDEEYLSVMQSFDDSQPGWYVGANIGDLIFGGVVGLDGGVLRGEVPNHSDSGDETIALTLAEEGDDGLLLTLADGSEYHFVPYDIPEAAFSCTVNTRGDGSIAYAEAGSVPEFDDEYPYTTAYIGLAEPEVYVFAAKPDEGNKFIKWTRNGENFSTEPEITLEITEDTELIAVFGVVGKNEEHVDLENVKTLGELLGLPDYGSGYNEKEYVFAFEQDGDIYRAVAELPDEVSEALWALDWEDEDFDAKKEAIISPLAIKEIENLSANEPTKEEMDALIGKTVKELFDDGWYNTGWNLYDNIFYMNHKAYSYNMELDGVPEDADDFTDEDMYPFVVKSVTFDGISDPSFVED